MSVVIEDMVEQRGLAAPEEAGEHGNGDFGRHLALGHGRPTDR